jgi:hypothetical protein
VLNKKKQAAFRAAYEVCGNITAAARAAKVTKQAHYFWLRTDAQYASAFRQSQVIAADLLESEAVRRAAEGWLEPVYYQGAKCGSVRRYDGGLMQFLLRGMLPEKYGAKTEISRPAGAPVQPKVEVIFVKPDHPAERDISPVFVKPEAAATVPDNLPAGHERSRIVDLPPVPTHSKSFWTQ